MLADASDGEEGDVTKVPQEKAESQAPQLSLAVDTNIDGLEVVDASAEVSGGECDEW